MSGSRARDYPCAGCGQYTEPQRDDSSASSRMTEYGRVDRVDDVCPDCSHVMVESLSGPGARRWAAAQGITLSPDAA